MLAPFVSGRRARIAVVGTGWWATRVHLPALAANPDAELVAVADRDPERAHAAAARFGVPRSFGSHRELLGVRPDAVVVATPHDAHFEIARDCLSAGCDVLVEKPMVTAVAEGRRLVELARRSGRRLHVGYPYPYTTLAQSLRGAVRSGRLGHLHLVTATFATSVHHLYPEAARPPDAPDALFPPSPSTYNDPERGGGQAHTQVSHIAALLFFVTGLRPREVRALAESGGTRVDAWDVACFRADGATLGTVASAGTVPRPLPTVAEIRLFGETGHACYDLTGGTLEVQAADGPALREALSDPAARYPREAPCRRLVDGLLGRAPVLVDGDLGLLVVEFVSALLASARTGRPRRLGSRSKA